MLERLLRRLSERRGPAWLAGLAALLSLRAIGLGFQLDDHWLRARAISYDFAHSTQLWAFPHALLVEQRARGYWAWWASPRLAINFLRPFSSLLHWLEFQLWPDSPAPMMSVNVVIYTALVWVAAKLYRALALPPRVAALAGLLFAVDEGHATSVGWLAGRNTMLATLCSLSAVWMHIEARKTRRRQLQWVACGLVSLALLSAEAGAWSIGFLLAYALVLEEGPLLSRLATITPQLALALAWTALYIAGGFGVHGVAWYRELSDPIGTISQGLLDLPLWSVALFGPNWTTFSIMLPPSTARLAALPFAVLACWLLLPLLPSSKQVRFFALATGFGLCPLMLTIPADRTVIGIGFASFGWLAALLTANDERRWHRALCTLLRWTHLWIAAASFIVCLGSVGRLENKLQALARAGLAKPGVTQVILVNSPFELLNNTVPYPMGMDTHAPNAPQSFHALYAGASTLEVQRVDERTLDVRSREGWGHEPVGRIFCADRDLPRVGDERHIDQVDVRVVEVTPSGLPSYVRFHFTSAIDDPARAWLVWVKGQPIAWSPPSIGGRASIAGVSFITGFELDHL